MMRARTCVAAVLAVAGGVWGSAAMAIPADNGFDTTFGTDGVVTVAVGDTYVVPDGSHSLYLQPDGKVVVAGYSDHGGPDRIAVIRLDQNGVLDPTFGLAGRVTTSVGNGNDRAFAVTGQADGKLLVAGLSWSTNDDFAVLRYGPTGALDPTFGVGGRVTTSVGPSSDSARAVLVQPDGAIVVAGSASNGSNNDFAVVRYTANGSLDTSFGTGGKVTTPFGTLDDDARSMALRSDGSLVVVGQTSLGSGYDIALAAYTSTGTLDSSFGVGGKVTTSAASGSSFESAYAVAVQADGRIVVAGQAAGDFVLVRYLSTGVLDPSFGAGGVVVTPLSSGVDQANDLAIRSDGGIVVGGYTGAGGFTVARYLPDGTLDTTFGQGGTLIAALSTYETIQAVALDAQERIVAAGDIMVGSDYHFAVARYHPDGRIPPPQPELVLPPLISEPPPTTTTVAPSTTTTTTVPSPPTSAPDTTLPNPPAAAPPDTFEVLVDGELVESGQTVQQDGTVVITGDDFSLAVQADQGAGLRLSGQGYEPGSQVQAWLFSTPTYLGAATVADDGSFQFEAELNGVDSGAHTLQLTGTAEGGGTRIVNVGIVVAQSGVPTPVPGELPSTGSDAAAVWWALLAIVAGVVLVRRVRSPMHRRG